MNEHYSDTEQDCDEGREDEAFTPTEIDDSDAPISLHQTLCRLRDSGQMGELTATEARILLVLITYADWKTGEAYPATKTIAELANVKPKSRALEALQSLKDKGILITVREGGGRTNTSIRRIASR